MDYRKEYEKWLASPALSEDERAELRALEGNDKEIKARFYGPLEFGTAGLRGTMYTGLHNMNRHVIRWATQGFAVLGSNCIPIPGAMGVSDYLMLEGFGMMMPSAEAANLELLSRGLSFYLCITVCGISVLLGYLLQKRRNHHAGIL